MKFFGPTPWNPHLERTEIPVGSPCDWCTEVFTAEDLGLVLPYLTADGLDRTCYHRECMLRSVIGSVAHQQQRCSCFRGPDSDTAEEEYLGKRIAAQMAAQLSANQLSRDWMKLSQAVQVLARKSEDPAEIMGALVGMQSTDNPNPVFFKVQTILEDLHRRIRGVG